MELQKIAQICLPADRRISGAKLSEKNRYVDATSFDTGRNTIAASKDIRSLMHSHHLFKEIHEGDILVSTRRWNLGAAAMVPSDLDGQAASRDIVVLRPNHNVVERRYLFYFVSSRQFASMLSRKIQGAVDLSVSDSDFNEIELPLPDLCEQRRICEILDETNNLRIQSDEIEKKYFRTLLALYFEKFGDPATNSKDWPVSPLETIITEKPQIGIHANSTNWTEGMPRYLRISDITEKGHLEKSQRVSLDLEDWSSYRLTPGDLLFIRLSRRVGRTYLHQTEAESCVFSNDMVRIKINRERMLPWYFFAFTQTDYFQKCIKVRKAPSIPEHVSVNDLLTIKIQIPPMAKQETFAELIQSLHRIYVKQSTTKMNIQRICDNIIQRAFFSLHEQ